KSEGMYANEPFITREGKTLNVVSDGGVEYNYGNVDESEYLKWNEWAKKSSKQLMSVGIVDYIKTGELDPYPVWQKGMTYVSWQPMGYKKIESQMSFPRMEKETNASWVNIVTTWYQEGVDSTEIIPHPDKTPNEEALEFMFKRARRLGLHIMFTPLVDLLNKEGGVWRSDISFHTNEEWDAWFASYRNFILKYAEVAEKNDMDIFNVGTELYFTTSKRPDKWVELIKDVRKVFSGRLIYTANWFEEYKEVRFWEYLDYAGISAYFPLADDDKPSYGEIKKNCEKWAVEIEAWQKIHGKPVVFSEVGYKSIEGAAKEPWNFISGGKVDIKQQYNCYKAVLETFWDKEWFYGMYWWAWRTNVLISGKFHRGYTPYDKPAAKLLYKWYMKPDPHKYISKVRLVTDLLEKRAEQKTDR
ncbi:MAG: hypothetical protein KAI70_01305, partial [Candidatus Omnitrophica bacterium]|nr:hypothetical protein [Candidatus Omnitrophota bacterium]